MSRSFLSPRHKSLTAYVPGEQPQGMSFIKLNTNESPYPPSPGVLASLKSSAMEKLNLYPNPDGDPLLLTELAAIDGLSAENVIIGNGSDELLAFAFHAFCGTEHPIAFPDITYGFYPVYAELYGIPYTEKPLSEDFRVCVEDYAGINENIVIANPNAPTGIALPLSDVERILRTNPNNVVIIDEAYVDFGGETASRLVPLYDNLLVIRTFSKSRSLAGARFAYAVGQTGIIGDLNRLKYSFNPYNVGRIAQAAALAALKEQSYYDEKCREIIDTREKTADRLIKLGFTVTPSLGNFLFVTSGVITGQALYKKLRSRGILIRHFDKKRISDYVRITVGTPEQMDALISAVSAIVEEAAQ